MATATHTRVLPRATLAEGRAGREPRAVSQEGAGYADSTMGGESSLRTRGFLAHPLLAILVLLALVGGLALPLDASPAQAAEPGRSLGPSGLGEGLLAPAALASAVDGPGHHFGFRQASVLAQATPADTPTATATATPPTVPAQQVPCASVAGQTCTVTGTGSGTTGSVTGTGTVQSNGGMAWSLTASVPTGFLGAPVIPAGTIPVATFTTTSGTETITCSAVTFVAGGTQTTVPATPWGWRCKAPP